MVRKLATTLLVGVLTAPFAPSIAHASEAKDPEGLFLRAVAKHKAGDAAGAIALLEKAKAADPHPTLLFNLAVLYDRSGNPKQASRMYEAYLGTEPEDAGIAMLRYRQIAPKEAEAYAKARKAGEGGDPKAADSSKKKKKKKKKKRIAKKEAGGDSPMLSYTLLGAGALALVSGTVFGALTLSDVSNFMQSTERAEAQEHADAARSHQLMANISYVAGLAALGGGVAMLLVSETGASGTPLLIPAISPTHAGTTLTLDF